VKYHIYVEDIFLDDLIRQEGPLSEIVLEDGFIEEKTIYAENIDEAVKAAQEWAAALSSEVSSYVTVVVEELETGEHRRLEVWVKGDETAS
jgi:hypothetical protein